MFALLLVIFLFQYVEPKDDGLGHIRVDTGIMENSEISIYYDPMIAKLITYGADRNEAIEHMRHALDTFVIRGVTHNINFLRAVLDKKAFLTGKLSTNFIPEEFPKGFQVPYISCCYVISILVSVSVYTCDTYRRMSSVLLK